MGIRRAGTTIAVALLLSVGAAIPASADSSGSGVESTATSDVFGRSASEGAKGNLRAAAEAGVFITDGDRVHISSNKKEGRVASAHGWWRKINGPGTKAKVTVWLQVKAKSGNKWHSVSKKSSNVKSANKRSSKPRTTARKKCSNKQSRQWRTVIDVDIIGVNDSPEKAYTKPVKVRCGV
ncbi:hypothetical protein ABT381_15510 [Streptomyces sp. NPDC000151]|uniref:hypothetical protein n=1 Tax=Streptomyces sp. NPDC000151 TaxID=3154244 RepID=UPI00331EA0C2